MWGSKAAPARLNIGTKDELEVTGYARNRRKLVATIAGTVLSCGLLLFPLSWRPSFRLPLTHSRCPLHQANTVLLKDIHGQEWEEEVVREEIKEEEVEKEEEEKGESKSSTHIYFINQKIKYIWEDATCTFVKLSPLESFPTFNTLHQRGHQGLSQCEARRRLALYGENYLDVSVLSLWQLLLRQVVNPFYVCQAVVVCVWLVKGYYITAATIAGLTIATVVLALVQGFRQSEALKKTVSSQSEVKVLREGMEMPVSSRTLVPGDVILVEEYMMSVEGERLEVDAVLLQGSVVTNEAMLTGEAIPVTKICAPRGSDALFDPVHHCHHVLQGGTQVLQVRGASQLPALVINTGFYTARGELVRSILYPKPHHLHLYWDLLWILGTFLIIGLAAMVWSGLTWRNVGTHWSDNLLKSLELLTFVVPPLLPATITAITAWATQRLRRRHIFCLASNYILPAGDIDVLCFDKTGTLTEDDLDLAGVIPVVKGEFERSWEEEDLPRLPPDQPITRALAACHTLTTTANGTLWGYPVDVKIFNSTAWTLHEPGTSINPDYSIVTPVVLRPSHNEGVEPGNHELATIRSFPFESQEQRTTVVTINKVDGAMQVFIKGAVERLVPLCRPHTVPKLLGAAVDWYTRQGLRVLAVAGRTIIQDLSWNQVQEDSTRESLEEGCEFLGLVVLQNKVKPETPLALARLHAAHLNTIMLTGDHLLTAVSVGRESGLVGAGQQVVVVKGVVEASSKLAAKHIKLIYYDAQITSTFTTQVEGKPVRREDYVLAMEGDTLELLETHQDTQLVARILHRTRIFARMRPQQKVNVVERLQNMGRKVLMCGDGCNDCGALKAADCGISLSSAEASVAAPFTSRRSTITCVPALLSEGRAVLVSTHAAVKYNIISGFIALICVVLQYAIHTEPTDYQYVMMYLVLIIIPALVIGGTGPPSRLTPSRPEHRLLSPLPLLSILSFIAIQGVTSWMMLSYIQGLPWFVSFVYDRDAWPLNPSYENTCLIQLCYFSLVGGALVVSHGSPFRLQIVYNYVLTGYLVVAGFFCIFITFYTGDWLVGFLGLLPFPEPEASGVLFCAAIVSFAVSFLWERWVLYGVLRRWVFPWCHRLCLPQPLYARLEDDLRADLFWPQLSPSPHHQYTQPTATEDKADTEEEEEVEYLDEFGEESMLMRKLTRRHQFKASVKRYPAAATEAWSPDPTSATPTGLSDTYDSAGVSFQPTHHQTGTEQYAVIYSPPPQSASYRDPIDALQPIDGGGGEGGRGAFTFNDSVRNQIMKGTGGVFKTFRATVKKQEGINEDLAEPYEVVCLTDQQQPEHIYAAIPESGSEEEPNPTFKSGEPGVYHQGPGDTTGRSSDEIPGEPVMYHQDPRSPTSWTPDEIPSPALDAGEPDMYHQELGSPTVWTPEEEPNQSFNTVEPAFYHPEPGDNTDEVVERRAAGSRVGHDASLLDQMNLEWRRISGSPLLPHQAPPKPLRTVGVQEQQPSQNPEIWTMRRMIPPDQLYDVPKKPPRPVSGVRIPPQFQDPSSSSSSATETTQSSTPSPLSPHPPKYLSPPPPKPIRGYKEQ